MNQIIKGTVFNGNARVTVIEIKDMVNEEIALHDLSPLSAAILGRAMTAGAYISTNLKDNASFSISFNGGGQAGSVVVAGESGNYLRGYVANPSVDLPLKENGHLDVGQAVGKDGFVTVIKDLGLKEPYVGRTELVSGEIAEDFAKYLLTSEGIKSAVALGVLVDKTGCKSAGGVIVEALPDCDDNMLFILEDVMANLSSISEIIAEKGAKGTFDYYFAHLDGVVLSEEEAFIRCNCSEEKIKSVIKGIGKKEADGIIKDLGRIEVNCQFCGKKYVFTGEEVDALWAR